MPLNVVFIWLLKQLALLRWVSAVVLVLLMVFLSILIVLPWFFKGMILSILGSYKDQDLVIVNLKIEKNIEYDWFKSNTKEAERLGFIYLSDFRIENPTQFHRTLVHPHNHAYLEIVQAESKKEQKSLPRLLTIQSRFSDGWGLSHYLSEPGEHFAYRTVVDQSKIIVIHQAKSSLEELLASHLSYREDVSKHLSSSLDVHLIENWSWEKYTEVFKQDMTHDYEVAKNFNPFSRDFCIRALTGKNAARECYLGQYARLIQEEEAE